MIHNAFRKSWSMVLAGGMAAGLALAGGVLTGNAVTDVVTAKVVQARPDGSNPPRVNRYIRAHGGVPPCTHEDGSGQPGPCYWDASKRGNGKGRDYVAVPAGKGKDKRIVFLTRK